MSLTYHRSVVPLLIVLAVLGPLLLVVRQPIVPLPSSPVAPSTLVTQSRPLPNFASSGTFTAVSNRRLCHSVGERPPDVHFEQVHTYVGPVPVESLREALHSITELTKLPNASDLIVFALDGTLLNLLRWGRIVNDNDVDLGFFFRSMPMNATSAHYHTLYSLLAEGGIVDAPTERDKRKLIDSRRVVKPGKCKVRRMVMMQCRHRNGVIFDLFGPSMLFAPITHLAVEDVVPSVLCRCFNASFPCPRNALKVLKNFTVNVEFDERKPPRFVREFDGCAMFPKRSSERDASHVRSIVYSVQLLEQCGWPSLIREGASEECRQISSILGDRDQ